MPAPKNPNTAAATAVLVRRAQERKAAELTAAGWLVFAPESADAVRVLVEQAKARGEAIEWHIDLKGQPSQ